MKSGMSLSLRMSLKKNLSFHNKKILTFVFHAICYSQNGESVMIKVATGGDSKSGEQVI